MILCTGVLANVVTCLNGEPPGKSDIGLVRVEWRENDSTQEQQIGAAGQHLSPACRAVDHVAHVLLHV